MNNKALAQRVGVLSRPSRSGSSPIHSRIVRQAFSIIWSLSSAPVDDDADGTATTADAVDAVEEEEDDDVVVVVVVVAAVPCDLSLSSSSSSSLSFS